MPQTIKHPHQHATKFVVSYMDPSGVRGIHGRFDTEKEAEEGVRACATYFKGKAKKINIIQPVTLPRDEWSDSDPFEAIDLEEATRPDVIPGSNKPEDYDV
jgi:hypothetical protein